MLNLLFHILLHTSVPGPQTVGDQMRPSLGGKQSDGTWEVLGSTSSHGPSNL